MPHAPPTDTERFAEYERLDARMSAERRAKYPPTRWQRLAELTVRDVVRCVRAWREKRSQR